MDTHVREEVARQLAAQKARDRKAKLTWSTPAAAWKNRDAEGYEGAPVGEQGFDRRLPYGAYGEYRIQNCRIYLTNGQEVALDDVEDTTPPGHTCSICRYRREGPCRMRELVGRQLDAYKREASELDPFLCRYCFRFTSNDPDEYAKHQFTVHAAEFAKNVGVGVPSSADPDSASVPAPASQSLPEREAEAAPPPAPLRGTTTGYEPVMKYAETATPIPPNIEPPKKAGGAEPIVPGLSFHCAVPDKDGKSCGRVFERQSALKRHVTVSHKA